jgi:hypothetical protein
MNAPTSSRPSSGFAGFLHSIACDCPVPRWSTSRKSCVSWRPAQSVTAVYAISVAAPPGPPAR